MSGYPMRLRVFQAVDHFGPGLSSEPYWVAEVYEANDNVPGDPMWVGSYGTWREALYKGLGSLARYYRQAAA